MSNVLRSTTFQLEFNGNDGITGVKTFTKAVRDADAVTEELNRTLGENTTVTVKNVKGKKELTAQARLVANEMARNENRTQRLTEQYSFMASTVGKTADEIQVLSAVQQLGANASEKQRKQVEQSVISYQKLRDSQNQQQGSMRNSRGVMQNFGWQMQDTIVQLQMGTSAFVVLSQQGSQMAAAFGPKGAVIGAFIALAGVVGGTLFKSLQSATEKTKDFDKANKAVSEYVTINSEGVAKLSSRYEELARYSKEAADAQLAIVRVSANQAQAESVKLIGEEIKGLARDLKTLDKYASDSTGFGVLGKLKTKDLDLMKESFKRLQGEVNPENIANFVSYLGELETSGKKGNEAVSELMTLLNTQLVSMEKNKKILEDTKDGWQNLSDESTKTSSKIVENFEKEARLLAKQTETYEQEYERRRKVIFDFLDNVNKDDEKSKKKASKAFADLLKSDQDEKEKIRKDSFDKQWKDITTAFEQEYNRTTKQTETIEQEYSRRYALIKSYIEKPGYDVLKVAKAEIALEEWKTAAYQKEYDKRERVRRQIENAQTAAYQKEYDKRERVRRQIENAQTAARGQTDPVGAEESKYATNIKTLEDQKLLLKEDQLEEIKRINGLIEAEEERHKDRNAELEMEGLEAQIGAYALSAQSMTNLVDLMSTGAESVRQQTEDMNATQKAMFVTTQIIAAAMAVVNGISMGSKLADAAATYDWTGATSISWLSIGTAIGAAQAGAIMGTTIAGAFDNGGYIPAGQMGAVAGFGDEFVNGTLIQGPANVTSRKDTAELLRDGGQSGTSTKLNISVENKIEGGQYRVEQINETDVKIIAEQVFSKNIDSGVSGVLSNSNSKTSKSMRKSYKVARNL